MLTFPLGLDPPSGFDQGDSEPYASALRDPERSVYLRTAGDPSRGAARLDIPRFLTGDDSDAAALAAVTGPVLDIGCGPGRFVHAAIMAGHLTLGIDISGTAVQIAQEHGLPVLRRSVFQDLPGEGTWGTALLIDGNLGIGGDPAALLRRCGDLVRAGDGRVLVEAHPDADRDRVFVGVLVDDLGRRSLPFPWAEAGLPALRRYADEAGLAETRVVTARGRTFAECARR